jgi:calpain-15
LIIPFYRKGGPIFSKSDGHELWTLFLEKAYSKIYGTYDKIESGLAGHALRDLTGAPYEYFSRD